MPRGTESIGTRMHVLLFSKPSAIYVLNSTYEMTVVISFCSCTVLGIRDKVK